MSPLLEMLPGATVVVLHHATGSQAWSKNHATAAKDALRRVLAKPEACSIAVRDPRGKVTLVNTIGTGPVVVTTPEGNVRFPSEKAAKVFSEAMGL